ncbi:hypothetical protein K438DRAFT_1495412, partial [Mycena galopus ATCC 62051]
KYGMEFATIFPSTEILRELPLWHHPGEDPQKRQTNNGVKAKCLREKHAATNIGHALDLTQRLRNPLHSPRASCVCDECEGDRDIKGCINPHACATAATSRLGQILPKWIPKENEEEGRVPATMHADQGDKLGLFIPPRIITSLAQGLRAMTHRTDEPKERINPRPRRRAMVTQPPIATTIYIAGVVHTPLRTKRTAAVGIFVSGEDDRSKGRCIPTLGEQSQYVAEFFATHTANGNV